MNARRESLRDISFLPDRLLLRLLFYPALSGRFWIGVCDKTSTALTAVPTAAVKLNTIIG
jgi:hypothetical protein